MPVDDVRNDPILQALKGLRTPDLDRAHQARLRERCRGALRRRGWRQALADFSAVSLLGRVLEPAVVAAVCVVYLSEIVRRALSLLQ